MELLARWWSKKYQLPSNHDLFLDRTEFDLLVEFYEDQFTDRPIERYRGDDGEVQFTNTGDELIDKWEEQIARGEEPDLSEAFKNDDIDKVGRLRKKASKGQSVARSIKDTMDMVTQEAKSQQLEPPTPKKYSRTFG